MTIVPVAEFKPDSPDLSDATNIAVNVVPLTVDSYGPLNAYAATSNNSIDSTPIGMGFGEDSGLLHHTYAGTVTRLWEITGGTTTWTDVTPTAGLNAFQENWHFAQYKNWMIATDFWDPIQYQDMGAGGPFIPLNTASTMPRARFLAVAKDFLITANTFDQTGDYGPQRVWWSGAGDPTNFPTPGSVQAQIAQSDYNDCFGPQGEITGLVPNLQGADCAVFFERGVWRMNYAGPPNVFTFYPALMQKGCIAPNSLVPVGTVVYFLGEDGFYSFDGYSVTPIGTTKVDRWFFSNVDATQLTRVIGAAGIEDKAVFWIFPSIGVPSVGPPGGPGTITPTGYLLTESQRIIDTESFVGLLVTTQGTGVRRQMLLTPPGTVPDQRVATSLPGVMYMLCYRWDLQRWSMGVVNAAWVNRVPTATASSVAPLAAGYLQLGAIGLDNTFGYFSGTPLGARIGTKVAQITPDKRTWVYRTRPLVEISNTQGCFLMTEPSGLTGTGSVDILTESGQGLLLEGTAEAQSLVTVALSARNSYYEVETFGAEVPPDISGDCPQRSDGRYHRGRITMKPGNWVKCAGMDFVGKAAGIR